MRSVTEPSHTVFLSYASQDAGAAQKIYQALCAAGIEVFLDQSTLRGGDAWDQKIRHEIRECALFIPIVSQHTQERLEAYFRHEWNLAVARTHHMAQQKHFLLPVVIDGTRDQEAFVPDAFRAVQWTRLPGGETPPAFVERIQLLLTPAISPLSAVSSAAAAIREPGRPSRRFQRVVLAIGTIGVVAALAYFVANEFRIHRNATSEAAARAAATPTTFNPPPNSIAVLPFVNLSGDKEQEYFSDGLTEELLNSLARIKELQVAARTSSFYFRGKDVELSMVARRLNVASVLEGSVRRSGHKLRITAQLSNAVNGFDLWSQTYDRDLGDVLDLQREIAESVAAALKVALLGDFATTIEVGGTRNPEAFDAYLRASKADHGALDKQGLQAAIAGYTAAIRLDPAYAIAYADRSVAFINFARTWAEQADKADYRRKAEEDARKAVTLAPDLADGHLALAKLFEDSLAFAEAAQEYERALNLEPGNAKLLRRYGWFAVLMGRTEAGLAAARRSVVLDPLNPDNHFELGASLVQARRFAEAIGAFKNVIAVYPDDPNVNQWLGMAYYESGDFQSARAWCEKSHDVNRPFCLALVYGKLGRRTDAETMLNAWRAEAVNSATSVAMIYAQWGDAARALEALETAVRLRDPLLERLKVNDLLDPLRLEPRFRAIERELKFPE